jgi:GNAT superfamily N-acetyltransferase
VEGKDAAHSATVCHREDAGGDEKTGDGEIEYCAFGQEGLDEIKPLWETLNKYISTISPHFSDLVSLRTFAARKEELREKSLRGVLRVDLAKDVSTGQIIGYAVTTLSEADAGEIDSIFVKEAYRGTGIGSRLMKRALAWLDENRAGTKTIAVSIGNERVHRFYRQFGFLPRATTLIQKIV